MNEQGQEQQTVDVVDRLPGEERGIPSVNDVRPSRAKRTVMFAGLLLVIGIFVGLGYWKYQRKEAQQQAAEAKKDLQLSSAVPPRTFVDPPPTAADAPPLPGPGTAAAGAAPLAVVPAPAGAVAPPLPGSAAPRTGTGAAGAPGAAPARPRVLDKAESSLMAGGDSPAGQLDRAGAGAGTGAGPAVAQVDAGQQQAGGGMAAMLTSTQTPARAAGMLGNRNFILAKGSFIDCALQTRLDSTVPGMTACVVTRDIYSDNGAMKLIEKGSTISGEYQANMRQGMARIFVLWTRIKTTKGVVVNLDSPATDALGGAGLPGVVDTHFWQRFGGAILLSLVSDVGSAVASSSGGGGGSQINFNGTANASSQVVAESLRGSINIPPTLTKNQGEQVGVYVARDLDFSKVYDVAAE
jgi:type IV secretion system protein VirB10